MSDKTPSSTPVVPANTGRVVDLGKSLSSANLSSALAQQAPPPPPPSSEGK